MSLEDQSSRIKLNDAGRIVIAVEKPPRPQLDTEIDIIRRTLYNVLDRLERLKQNKLTTS